MCTVVDNVILRAKTSRAVSPPSSSSEFAARVARKKIIQAFDLQHCSSVKPAL
jgi:hypothetical protein